MFIEPAISKEPALDIYRHLKIEDGFLSASDGVISMGEQLSECSLPNCNPDATIAVKALKKYSDFNCRVLENKNLQLTRNRLKITIPCYEGAMYHSLPEGREYIIDGQYLIEVFKKLLPFITDDQSKVWPNSMLLTGQSAFATNNIVLIEHWLPFVFPFPVALPKVAIEAVIKTKLIPEKLRLSDSSISFCFENDKWLRSQLFTEQWPDVNNILNKNTSSNPTHFEGFFEDVKELLPFTEESYKIYIDGNVLHSHPCKIDGVVIETDNDLGTHGVFNITALYALKDVAIKLDLTTYPRPCYFVGESLRGILIGMKA